MSDQIFLRLYGENGSRQRVVFEALLDGGTIRTRICNRVTGAAETGAVTYYRVSLFDHAASPFLITTFDLLRDATPVVHEPANNRLKLNGLRVRCVLSPPPDVFSKPLPQITFKGTIEVASSGGKSVPVFRGLSATYKGLTEEPKTLQIGGTPGDVPLTKLALVKPVDFDPQVSSNLFKVAMGISGNVDKTSNLRLLFAPIGKDDDKRVVLTFLSSLKIGDGESKLDFRRQTVKVKGGSNWSFVQRAPAARTGDFSRELEASPNRWTVLVDSGDGATTPDLLGLWNRTVADPYLKALRLIQAGRPLSVVPTFGAADPVPVRFVYEVTEPQAQKTDLKPDEIAFSDRNGSAGLATARVLSLQPGAASQGNATSQLNGLRVWDNEPLVIPWRIVPPVGKDQAPETAAGGLVIGAIQQAVAAAEPGPDEQRVRLGSLDLTFPPASPQKPPADELSVFAAEIPPEALDRLEVTVSAHVTASAVAPGGQDPLPQEQFVQSFPEDFQSKRQPPLIVPLSPPERPPEQREERRALSLAVTEKTDVDSSQTLTIQLFDRGLPAGGNGSHNVVVIDRQPFLVAKVNVPSFQGSAETSEIGNWSGDSPSGASWELSSRSGIASGFTLELPPQGVGEAMEKVKGPVDIDQDQPADFRFTPPARFQLQPSFFEQRFAEASWNLRRILGNPGDRAPGAGIDKLDFEMFYGLGCAVESPFLRLAEIASRLGAIPGDVPERLPWPATSDQNDVHAVFRAHWAEIFRSYFSRLAVLEPWDDHQPLELTLDDGVRYELRRSSHLRYPIVGETLPAELKGKIPAEDDGLAGGVAWGFESANVYHATWRDPKSTSGKLVRPYFSALGGWGFQKASFDHDRTTFYTDTAMGRTFFLSLERIGRIGVLWNVAKHVIIYERTVAPTEQFIDPHNPDKDKQDRHERRPLLRKVKEFVEILQPVRSYPESSATPKVTRGFVVGSDFKSRIINVDSSWGHDVGTIGWQVPLWKPDEAAAKPTVYPKPHILLEVGADPEGGSPTVKLEIDEPEKLVFYTDTRPETDARTDLWPAIEGIDYLDLPAPKVPKIDQVPAHVEGDLDRPLPDAPAVEPGFDALTWAVMPAERGTNLVIDRTDQALSAVIRNVTMMRAKAQKEIPAAVQTVARLGDPVEKLLQDVLARVPVRGEVTTDLLDRLAQEVGLDKTLESARELKARLDALRADPNVQKILQAKGDLCLALQNEGGRQIDRLAQQITALREAVRRDMVGFLRQLDGQKETLRVEAKGFVTTRIDELRRIVRLAQAGLDQVTERLASAQQDLAQLSARVKGEIHRAVLLIDDVAASAGRELERIRREIKDLRVRLSTLLREAESRLAGLSEPRVAKLAQKVRESLASFRTEGDKILAKIDAELAKATPDLSAVKGFLGDLSQKAEDLLKLAQSVIDQFQGPLGELQKAVDAIDKVLVEAQTKAEDAVDQFFATSSTVTQQLADDVDQALDGLQTAILAQLDTLKTQVKAAIKKACDQVLGGIDEALQEIENLVGAGGQAIAKAIQKALDDLKGQIGSIDLDAVRRAVAEQVGAVRRLLEPLATTVQKALGESLGAVSQLGDGVLRLLRAFGDAPSVPNLGFNRRQIAYFFDELAKAVDLTPVTALVNRLGDELKALGIRVPTTNLLDRILPAALEDFDLSKIFPDFSGLKLDNLFPGLKMPAIANDKVKVTQGVDPETRRAWMQADLDVPIDQPSDVFVTGAVAVRLLKARFTAQARIEASLNGPPKQTVHAEVRGDWQLSVGNTPIVLFRDTALIFEDGRVRFDLSADKVEFTAALRFLADLIKKIGYSEGGFSVKLLQEGALPVGVESVLDLPLPDITTGAFSITSLRLGSTFALRIDPRTFDFSLETRFHLGTKEAPFALAIWILTGGGWLDARARYMPRTGEVESRVSIGIVAGGSLAFNFGPIHGGVYLFFGIEAEFVSKTGSGQTLNVAILLLVRGEVQVLGFLSVGLHLLLQAQYQQSGRLIGTGTLSIEIKVCRFFTVSVSTSVRYEFAKGSGGGASNAPQSLAAPAPATAQDRYDKAATAYIGMLH